MSFDGSGVEEALDNNAGALDVTTDVVTSHGGATTLARGRGGGQSIRFPAFDPSATGQRAVLHVVPTTASNEFSPGVSDFLFGASFRLDRRSAGQGGDNGDNILQFGRYGDAAQYKLEVDGRSPACRVKGQLGVVALKTHIQVRPGDWYNATCRRERDAVTLTVIRYGHGGTARKWTKSAAAPIGPVTAEGVAPPLSIGGKLTREGRVDPSSDQFNGQVDDVVLRINRL
jgi:hypothetical protein